MRQQIIQNVGGKVYCEFPSRPSSVLVTIKQGTGGDLDNTAVVGAAATIEDFVLTYDEVGDLAPEIESKLIPGILSGSVAPRLGLPVEVRTPLGLTQVNFITLSYYTDPPDNTRVVLALRHPIPFEASLGSTVKSLRSYYTIAANQCSVIYENFRAVFTATIAGESVVKEVIYDVGLRTSDNPANVSDFLRTWADLRYSETNEWALENGYEALQGGWEDLWIRIRSTRRNPNRIRDVEPLKPLIVNRALRRLAKTGCVPPVWVSDVSAFIDLLDAEFQAQVQEVFEGLEWYDEGDDGVAEEPQPVERIRLTR